MSISAEYGQAKKFNPIDLAKHPSWKEANVAEQDVREAARRAKNFLKISNIDENESPVDRDADPVSSTADITQTGSSIELSIGYYASMFSQPSVYSAGVEAEIEEFITFMNSNRFMTVPDSAPTKFMDAYEFYEYNSSHLKENFPVMYKLMSIPLLLFMSNAKVESGFSTMNHIHNKKRNCLSIETVDSLMRVALLCPELESLKQDVGLCSKILSTWKALPSKSKYGSDKHKQSSLHSLVIKKSLPATISMEKATIKRKIDIASSFDNQQKHSTSSVQKKIKLTLTSSGFDVTRDGAYHEAISVATALTSVTSFREMITSSRNSIPQLPICRPTGIAYMKLNGAFYQLSKKDADWAIQDSASSAELVQLGVRSSDNSQSLTLVSCGHIFHTLRPGEWLMDEVINASVVLLRMYCFNKFQQQKIVITDIDFYSFMSTKLSVAEKHDLVIKRYFKSATMLAECKDMLIPILIHHHFILIVIDFKLKQIKLFDSLKGRQSTVTAHVSRYCEDVERFFNLSDSPVFTLENMSDQITHQGNSYDCGCYTIWNMIRYLQNLPFTAIPIDCRQKIALWILTQDHGVFFDKYMPSADIITIID
jgi:Ulp1 family protease